MIEQEYSLTTKENLWLKKQIQESVEGWRDVVGKTSKYKYVVFDNRIKKWAAQYKKIKLHSTFKSEEKALEKVISAFKENNIPLHFTHLEYLKEKEDVC